MDAFYVVFGIVIIALYLIAIGISIAQYIIGSLGLYKLAQKRMVPNAWLAWVPLVNVWTLGSIVDDFETEKSCKRKFRTILLILALITLVLAVAAIMILIGYMVTLSLNYGISTEEQNIAFLITFYAAVLPLSCVVTAYGAIALICTYKIHEYIYPEKAIKYIVISLLVPLGNEICVLKNAKRCPEKPCFDHAAPVTEV